MAVIALLSVVHACGLIDDPGRMTCEAWLATPAERRLALADRLVGASGELLEQIRIRQHRAPGSPRDALIGDLEGSLTKNCEVWPPRSRTLGEVLDALYR